jgi:glycosyltransferase involved in cell wall biosynthesis
MTGRVDKIVQLNLLDNIGGAASVGSTLHSYFRREGCRSRRIVGIKVGDDDATVELRPELKAAGRKLPLQERLARLFEGAEPFLRRRLERLAGLEDLGDPRSRHLLDLLPDQDEIVLCHNLHGGWFDLSVLPELSKRRPVVLLLHDPWMLAGHCAHHFDCEKWISGCGGCPYLDLQYSLKRDSTHANWLRKKRIYDECRLYLVTPSQWLMDQVQRSILAPAVLKSCVINNGVDREVFFPADKASEREALGIGRDEHVVMFAANGIRESVWKDYATMRGAVAEAAAALPGTSFRFLAVGEDAPAERVGAATIEFVPHQSSLELARYYRAADIYIHAARAENFPNTVVEALSCGTPVIATAVGGVPEQVKGMAFDGDASGLNLFAPEEATGILTPAGDAGALSGAIVRLFGTTGIIEKLSLSAARDAAERFGINRTGAQYLDFFQEVLADRHKHGNPRRTG